MSSGRPGFKRPYAFLIIGLMVVGVVAGAFYFYHPNCGGPSTSFSQVYFPNVGGQSYDAVNATFTGDQQIFVLRGVTFLTLAFSDLSQPHLSGSTCVTDSSTSALISLRVTSSTDGVETIPTMQFKGFLPQQVGGGFSSHISPSAGVFWYPNDAYVVLLVSAS